ncbi:hypothetical protein A9Q98_06970 [Thalassotalea sp. 42_200_T64]|nr:hypothetical protein A9Q98_06970 [Thalassotalea sp. 42_200_T64]
MKTYETRILKTAGAIMLAGGVTITNTALADIGDFDANLSGYVRTTAGISLENHSETSANETGKLTMARATVYLDLDVTTGPLIWKAVGKFDQEYQTDYLDDLEDLIELQSPGGNSSNGNFMDAYNTDEFGEFLREFYVEFAITDKLDLRFGKQQLVWGESDFFQAMDVVSGYDLRWRLFFENNEEWRKPLIIANFNLDLYEEMGGNLNFFIRPGWDREEDMGSNFNIEGGRWIPHPYRGVDFTAFTKAYQTEHKDGDWDDPTYGIRWDGTADSIGYSFAYIKTFSAAPIMNPTTSGVVTGAFGVTSAEFYGEEPENQVLGDWIYPEIDVFGFTVNGYSSTLNSTFSAEIAYTPDRPYNFGELDSSLPGWGGVIEKDTIVTMFRIDKELRLMDWLGTNRPSLSSIQLFDTYIIDYDKKDEIVEFASFGAPKREHTTYLTLFSLLEFNRDTIKPSFVVGFDLSNGGGFAIPAVEFVMGDDWRLKIEADIFWGGDEKQPTDTNPDGSHVNPLGVTENSAAFFDWFSEDDQLVIKLTRQF